MDNYTIGDVRLSDITLLDYCGNPTKKLDNSCSKEELTKELLAEWVPYIECHKCSRENTCPYTKVNPHNKNKKLEIKCGFKSKIISNFIEHTFDIFERCNNEQKEDYLAGLYYFSEYSLYSEQKLGILVDNEQIAYWESFAPIVFTNTIHLRDLLNKSAEHFVKIPCIYNKQKVLFVEGESEKHFFDRLKESGVHWFSDLIIEVCGGDGEQTKKRIEKLINNYKQKGYACFMEGDKDGDKNKAKFKDLTSRGILAEEQTFLFKHDFETSIPPKLFVKILKKIGCPVDIEVHKIADILNGENSYKKVIHDTYGINIDSYKTKIANELAIALCGRGYQGFRWYQDKTGLMHDSELGKFLKWVIESDTKH